MKKLSLFLCFVALLFSQGCDSSVLNVPPGDEITEGQIWNDEALLNSYVNDLYTNIGHGFYGVELSSGVDETKHTHGWDDAPMRRSNMTPDDPGFFGGSFGGAFNEFVWEEVYLQIRKINNLLANIDASELSASIKDNAKGQALYLRAFYYHNLLKTYGGVPIIETTFDLTSETYTVPRDPYSDVVDFIVGDLDEAATVLGGINDADLKSRGSVGAAMALKARVLLYAASDLYANAPSELLGYTGGDQDARWQAAKDAAEAVMDLGWYELYAANPAPGDSTAKNYADIWLQKDHSEMIFVREFNEADENDIHRNHGPNGYHNWGGDVPLQQMVDAYEMADGSEFDWGNPVHADNPYENRDPRFYASILYNGVDWRERPSDVIESDPEGIIQTAYFEQEGTSALRPGLDTRDGPVEDWNGTYTGYYMRKFLDETVNGQFDGQVWPWQFIRYAEVLLNYAEASIELGDEDDARDAINEIRERAGMPDITESGAALMDRYRNERRIELAYERHRYWDVRRWMIAPDVYEDGMGVEILGVLQGDGSYTFEYTLKTVDERSWDDKAYFAPIPRDEMDANDQLVPNPGYN